MNHQLGTTYSNQILILMHSMIYITSDWAQKFFKNWEKTSKFWKYFLWSFVLFHSGATFVSCPKQLNQIYFYNLMTHAWLINKLKLKKKNSVKLKVCGTCLLKIKIIIFAGTRRVKNIPMLNTNCKMNILDVCYMCR